MAITICVTYLFQNAKSANSDQRTRTISCNDDARRQELQLSVTARNCMNALLTDDLSTRTRAVVRAAQIGVHAFILEHDQVTIITVNDI